MEEEMLNLISAAEFIGVCEKTIRNHIKNPKIDIPYNRIGNLYKFKKSELTKWMKEGR